VLRALKFPTLKNALIGQTSRLSSCHVINWQECLIDVWHALKQIKEKINQYRLSIMSLEAVPQSTEATVRSQFPSLEIRCVAVLVRNPHKIHNMANLPEGAVVLLLRAIAAQWRLTPALVARFQNCGHADVQTTLEMMNLDVAAGMYVLVDTPPPRQIGDHDNRHKG
jgi:hypothetical protein